MDFNEYQSKARKTAIYVKEITKEDVNDIVAASYNINNNDKDAIIKDLVKLLYNQITDYNRLSNQFYCLIGLMSEVGELASEFKKVIRNDNGNLTKERSKKIFDEQSDCYWYLANLATELNFNMEDIAKHNIDKLQKRMENNEIKERKVSDK